MSESKTKIVWELLTEIINSYLYSYLLTKQLHRFAMNVKFCE